MIGRTGWMACVLAILGTSGCIAPSYEGVRIAREAGPSCDVLLECRNEVFVFVLGGYTPNEMEAMDKFQEGLNAGGYSKISTAQPIYASWMAGEMRRIHGEDRRAVFVIVGLDSAAASGVKLSEKMMAEGIPVQGVVVVDAKGRTQPPTAHVRTLMVSGGSDGAEGGASIVVPNPGSPGLPAEIKTIEGVGRLLKDVAMAIPVLPIPAANSDWAYPFAGDVLITAEPRNDSEWSFLFDQPGGMTRAIDEPLPPRAVDVNSNTAKR